VNAFAVEWIDLLDAELGQYMTPLTTADFQYATNLTDYNEQQVLVSMARGYAYTLR